MNAVPSARSAPPIPGAAAAAWDAARAAVAACPVAGRRLPGAALRAARWLRGARV